MAAFCACCGAEITLKAEACPKCGTPQHGMLPPELLSTLEVDADPSQGDVRISRKLSKPLSKKRQ
jgi:predicted amidophosphoribosyltransferase